MNLDDFKSQTEELSKEERADLAYFLLQTLEPAEEGVEASWDVEIHRRVEEIRSGRATGKPAEQVFAELDERYR
jgi:putative addiction module component (TIGR02574 family)